MQMNRKVQLGALAVVINGLLAATMLSSPALASSCTTTQKVVCLCQSVAGCQSVAPPNCTAVSAQCITLACGNQQSATLCKYQ